MKKIFGKYRIRIKIFLLFILLILIPYIMLIFVTHRVFQDYAGNNAGKNMEDVMISIGNQVGALLKTYEDSTMSLYYNGCVDMLEQEEKIERILKQPWQPAVILIVEYGRLIW